MRSAVAAVAIFAVAAISAAAQSVAKAPPGGDYKKKVSELVKLPDFLPGLGTLYVNPKTLSAGPFIAYDLAAPGGKVDHVSIYYNAGHPGVPDPHYHVVRWHVPKAQESLVAK
jgi:hypothetical protein